MGTHCCGHGRELVAGNKTWALSWHVWTFPRSVCPLPTLPPPRGVPGCSAPQWIFPPLFILFCIYMCDLGPSENRWQRAPLPGVPSSLSQKGRQFPGGVPIPPSGPYSDQHQCLPLRTLAAHRKPGQCLGWGAGTPHLPASPMLLVPPSPFLTVFCT